MLLLGTNTSSSVRLRARMSVANDFGAFLCLENFGNRAGLKLALREISRTPENITFCFFCGTDALVSTVERLVVGLSEQSQPRTS